MAEYNEKFNNDDFNAKSKFEIELLLKQREVLVENIKEINSNMFKVIVATIPVLITLLLSYSEKVIPSSSAPLIRFFIIQFIIILAMTISAFLFNGNVNRDYIVAVDKYLYDNYKISALFYESDLSREDITGTKGVFPLITLLIGVSSSVVVGAFVIYSIYIDASVLYFKSIGGILLFAFMAIEIIAYAYLIYLNHKRKVNKTSSITDACVEHLNRSKNNKWVILKYNDMQDLSYGLLIWIYI